MHYKLLFRSFKTWNTDITLEWKRNFRVGNVIMVTRKQNHSILCFPDFQVKLPRYASKNRDIKRELRKMDERAFFLDVVKDIANDLDLKSLTSKITENLAVLLDAEAASLFIVEGPKGKQTLVSKVVNMYYVKLVFSDTPTLCSLYFHFSL